jgi:hypothetical protein
LRKLEAEGKRAAAVESKNRNLFDQKILELGNNLQRFQRIAEWREPLILPEGNGDVQWNSFLQILSGVHGAALRYVQSDPDFKKLDGVKQDRLAQTYANRLLNERYPAAAAWERMLEAYRSNKPEAFAKAVEDFRKHQGQLPPSADKAGFEVFFNDFSPFHFCYGMYVIVFLLTCASWVGSPRVFNRTAVWLALLTVTVHTWALLARMYIQGRPPVTNLYSSAVFIGWGCVLTGLVLERIFRNGIGVAMASILGASTSLVAHYLAESSGDTRRPSSIPTSGSRRM